MLHYQDSIIYTDKYWLLSQAKNQIHTWLRGGCRFQERGVLRGGWFISSWRVTNNGLRYSQSHVRFAPSQRDCDRGERGVGRLVALLAPTVQVALQRLILCVVAWVDHDHGECDFPARVQRLLHVYHGQVAQGWVDRPGVGRKHVLPLIIVAQHGPVEPRVWQILWFTLVARLQGRPILDDDFRSFYGHRVV